MPDLPKSIAWCDDTLCVGFRRDYYMIKVRTAYSYAIWSRHVLHTRTPYNQGTYCILVQQIPGLYQMRRNHADLKYCYDACSSWFELLILLGLVHLCTYMYFTLSDIIQWYYMYMRFIRHRWCFRYTMASWKSSFQPVRTWSLWWRYWTDSSRWAEIPVPSSSARTGCPRRSTASSGTTSRKYSVRTPPRTSTSLTYSAC